MPFEVVHAHEGKPTGPCQGLCEGEPHQQGSNEPGRKGGRDSLDLIQGQSCLPEGLPGHGNDGLDMFSRRQFGNHPTIGGMVLDLGAYYIGKDSLF